MQDHQHRQPLLKLSTEEKEALGALLSHDGLKVLLKVMEALARSQAEGLLTYDLDGGSERGLALLKAQSDGARKLHQSIAAYLAALKRKHDAQA